LFIDFYLILLFDDDDRLLINYSGIYLFLYCNYFYLLS